jgi:glutamine amidotransferase
LHVFAHNGNLRLDEGAWRSGRFRPIGETDSERSFCYLLGELESLWLGASGIPELKARFEVVRRFAAVARSLGPANFVYCDGHALFAHSDVRRHAPGEELRAPGLHALWRNFVSEAQEPAPFGLEAKPAQREVLVASEPLGREGWIPLPRGELIAVVDGHLAIASSGVRLEATGLCATRG